jgi:hypothetical protein
VSWYFSVALPADATDCHRAADSLRLVARRAGAAAAFLDGQASLPNESFSGLAAQSYRTASGALATDCRGTHDDTLALAAALDHCAARISAVRRTLARIRDDAVAAGLDVSSDLVHQVPVPRTEQDATFRLLETAAAGAHAETESAYAAWWHAVQEFTKGPLPSRTGVLHELPHHDQRGDDR